MGRPRILLVLMVHLNVLCDDKFTLIKTFLEHMKCHPDREWGGIQPPPSAAAPAVVINAKNPSSDGEEELVEEDLAKDQKQLPILIQSNSNTTATSQGLGGHKRIHSQTNKDLFKSSSQQNKKPCSIQLEKRKQQDFAKKKLSSSNDSSDDHAHKCSVREKDFTSIKALSGHMRCHTEKDWRGIRPPPSAINASSLLSSVSDAKPPQRAHDDVHHQMELAGADRNPTVDLKKYLSGWAVTAKRGRKAIVENSYDGTIEDVYRLMSLAQGGDSSSKFEAKTSNEEIIMTTKGTYLPKKGRQTEVSADHPVKELRIEERKFDDGKNCSKDVQESEFFSGKSANSDQSSKGNIVNPVSTLATASDQKYKECGCCQEQEKKDLGSVNDDQVDHPVLTLETSSNHEKYKFEKCGKSFTTHQGFGANLDSQQEEEDSSKDHVKKLRIFIPNSFDESTSAAAHKDENPVSHLPTPGVKDCKESAGGPPDHSSNDQSKICNRNFPTTSQEALAGK
ncbi:hypothetical protein ACH5RR_038145 [Cinchona calisaya]|uniref:Uncharacterized protein n=1 Tax=Cinchona calisaya TaxID=153742 RepID=A0ABD2YAK0_9GENT